MTTPNAPVENQQPPAPTLESAMEATRQGMERALATGDANAAIPPSAQAQPAPVVQPPAPVVQPHAPNQAQPPATQPQFVSVDAFNGLAQNLGQFTQAITQSNLAMQQALHNQMNPPQPPQKKQLPSVDQLAANFRPPARQPGEDDATYNGRSQAALWDTMNQGVVKHVDEVVSERIDQAIHGYAQQVAQETARQRGEQVFTQAVQEAVRAQGVDPTTPAGQFLFEQTRNNVMVMAMNGQTQGWQEPHFRSAIQQTAANVRKFANIPPVPVPGQQPQLSVVPNQQAPIGGSGAGGGAPGVPPSSTAQQPAKTLEEAMERTRLMMVDAVKNGRLPTIAS